MLEMTEDAEPYPTRRTCGSEVSAFEAVRRFARSRETVAADSALIEQSTGMQKQYVKIRYWILYRNKSENLDLKLIQSQHQMLNAVYNGLNLGLKKMPTTSHYAFASAVGNANIAFLPSDHTLVDESIITRLLCKLTLVGINDALTFLQSVGRSPETGSINVIVAPLARILGEAVVGGNTCTPR